MAKYVSFIDDCLVLDGRKIETASGELHIGPALYGSSRFLLMSDYKHYKPINKYFKRIINLYESGFCSKLA